MTPPPPLLTFLAARWRRKKKRRTGWPAYLRRQVTRSWAHSHTELWYLVLSIAMAVYLFILIFNRAPRRIRRQLPLSSQQRLACHTELLSLLLLGINRGRHSTAHWDNLTNVAWMGKLFFCFSWMCCQNSVELISLPRPTGDHPARLQPSSSWSLASGPI